LTSQEDPAEEKSVAASTGGDLDRRLLEILVCPVTKGPLDYDREAQELISRQARLAYPIRDGIPIMLEEEARHLDDDADR
jgi:hypothetical protein